MSARDELEQVVRKSYVDNCMQLATRDLTELMTDAILAAGYRKPRKITTVEELDALPVGSVVKGERFGVAIKEEADNPVPWASDGSRGAETSADVLIYLLGTAALIFEPEVKA